MALLKTIPSFLFSHTVCQFHSTVPLYVTALAECTYSPLTLGLGSSPPSSSIPLSTFLLLFLSIPIFFLFFFVLPIVFIYLSIFFPSISYICWSCVFLSRTWYWLHFPRLLYLTVSWSHYTFPLPSHHPHTAPTLLTGIMLIDTNHPTPFSI